MFHANISKSDSALIICAEWRMVTLKCMYGGLEAEGLSKKKKKIEKELIDTDGSVVIAGGGVWAEVEEDMEGINGNGKNKRKIKCMV